MEIETKGFSIHCPGDPSVGIFPATWNLKGGYFFSDKEELASFKEGLQNLFTEYTGGFKVTVMTEEELEASEKAEAEFTKKMDDVLQNCEDKNLIKRRI